MYFYGNTLVSNNILFMKDHVRWPVIYLRLSNHMQDSKSILINWSTKLLACPWFNNSHSDIDSRKYYHQNNPVDVISVWTNENLPISNKLILILSMDAETLCFNTWDLFGSSLIGQLKIWPLTSCHTGCCKDFAYYKKNPTSILFELLWDSPNPYPC